MSKLDNNNVYSVDREEMYYKIIHLPDQIRTAYFNPNMHIPAHFTTTNGVLNLSKPINRVIIAGMGGSAISGDIMRTAYSHLIPIEVCKDYQIPLIKKDDLLVICSYSGNTEETISCFKQGVNKAAYLAAITSNGKLHELIDDNHVWCQLPDGYPPRAAIGFLFFSIILVLEKFGVIPRREGDVRSTISTLMLKAGAISGNVMTEFNITKQSALKIYKKIPLIYSSNPSLTPVAYRLKCQINENAKYPAFFHTLPEMNHNEIEAWENKVFHKIFIPIFISYIDEKVDYKKRVKFLQDLFIKENIEYLDFYAEGSNYIEKVFSLIYLSDMISYYLAILQNIDPTKIDYIEKLKDEIS
ncbi:MAG: bifunctional phosphoglucose/phosphomannose isomerase [Candidatus Cloacimonetes bacterium]|nr:bifunctional phosphoglucose/phosphomannose isomerase [Candidatus Cloacimonadota bacterium]